MSYLLIVFLFIQVSEMQLPEPVLNVYTSCVRPSNVLPVEEKAVVGMEL